jgi:hypothetical protein
MPFMTINGRAPSSDIPTLSPPSDNDAKRFGQHLRVQAKWAFATTMDSCLAEDGVRRLLKVWQDPCKMPEWFFVVPGDERWKAVDGYLSSLTPHTPFFPFLW